MLQQTQVDRVVDYYRRFLERFPDVSHLAAAPEADVLHAWEGLGYYRRARQLHAAAKQIVADHGGRLPASVAVLRGLPGVGRYTAGAIASIAFDQPEPIVEANSRRVLARLAGHRAPLGGATGDEPVWRIAAALLPAHAPSDWNQALMDLGATICTPRAPLCTRCPVSAHCVAHASGQVASIPAAAPRRASVDLAETVWVVRHDRKVLVVQRGPGEWWEGLWDFPRLPARAILGALRLSRRRVAGSCSYTVTHHRVAVTVATCTAREAVPVGAATKWVAWNRLAGLAMTAPGRRIAALVADEAGRGKAAATPRSRPAKRPQGGRQAASG